LKEMLDKAATLQMAVILSECLGKEKREINYGTGDGCVPTVLWSQGSAVATWDGGHHMDLNLFTFQENMQMHQQFADDFLAMTTSFAMVSHNQQPRGFGRVVNFKQEMK